MKQQPMSALATAGAAAMVASFFAVGSPACSGESSDACAPGKASACACGARDAPIPRAPASLSLVPSLSVGPISTLRWTF